MWQDSIICAKWDSRGVGGICNEKLIIIVIITRENLKKLKKKIKRKRGLTSYPIFLKLQFRYLVSAPKQPQYCKTWHLNCMGKKYFKVEYVTIFLSVFYISWWWRFKRAETCRRKLYSKILWSIVLIGFADFSFHSVHNTMGCATQRWPTTGF